MFRRLDKEHYVENPFLAHLQRLGWKVYTHAPVEYE